MLHAFLPLRCHLQAATYARDLRLQEERRHVWEKLIPPMHVMFLSLPSALPQPLGSTCHRSWLVPVYVYTRGVAAATGASHDGSV